MYFLCYLYMEVIYVYVYVCNVVENNFIKILEFLYFFGIIFNYISYEIKGIKLVIIKYVIERVLNVKENLFLDEYNWFLEYV